MLNVERGGAARDEIQSLDQIGLRNGTDKASDRNGFLSFYEPFLKPMRNRPVRILEIGVLDGGSVRTWRDYFPLGDVIGVDIKSSAVKHGGERLTIEIADQSKGEHLDRLAALGPFDLVVDDGSHYWQHQILTFCKLMPKVAPGGCYILEDLDTSYGGYARIYCRGGGMSAADYLKAVADRVVGSWQLQDVEFPDDHISRIAPTIDYLVFSRGTCLLRVKE